MELNCPTNYTIVVESLLFANDKDKDETLTNGGTFDLIVIGTGTAASSAAFDCRSAGWKVAIIDSLPFGGTCALRGCEPKKVLVEAAKTIDSSQRHENKGITGSERIDIKWSDLLHFIVLRDLLVKNRLK